MKFKLTAVFFAASTMMFGQYVTTRARLLGGPADQGKCSFELQVDGVVEVQVMADQARAQASSGASPQWRKMDCTMAMPANPAQFTFTPQGGRGKQMLAQDPNNNRGVASIRIEDQQGGSDTYRFDLAWRGTLGPQNSRNLPGRNGNPGNNSIFDNTPSWPDDNSGFGSGNGRVNYRGSGGGYFRTFRGSDDQLGDAQIAIDRSGQVRVELTSRGNGRIQLTGNVIFDGGGRLVANLSGGTMQGAMEILLDNGNRVQELAMTGVGPNRFELRWQPR